ncbi:uncharacterized protein LOC131600001 [Vicia villosa]|uniref:uncharacterized protein LOC131600001 n=1 Tax=Vicia villosa TaxID=3911 RepID=UPI00273B8704|nr:uncharacterized protein LOC131600001 [Vicia villosa]
MASHTPLEVKFAELEKAEQMHQNSRPKIQRVAAYLRNRKNIDKQYSPKLLSIGPIHHDNPNLKLGENYKLTWAVKYIQSTQQTREYLHQKIADNINELKGLYTDDVLALANTAASLKDFHSLEEKLSWLLFVDGCSLLYILEKLRLSQTDKPKNENPADQHDKQKDRNTNADQIGEQEHASINVDDKTDDKVDDEAEGHLNIKVDQLVLVMMDVLLLENQLPYRVLNLLWKNDDENLIDTMKDFLKNYHWTPPDKKSWRFPDNLIPDKLIPDKLKDATKTKQKTAVDNKTTGRSPPTHLLDLQRKMILKIEDKNEADEMEKKQSGINSEALTRSKNSRNKTYIKQDTKSNRRRFLAELVWCETDSS